MKNIHIIIFSVTALFCFHTNVLSQANLTIGTANGNAGTPVSVPVYASGIEDMQGFQFTIVYDNSKLSYVSTSDWSGGASASQVTSHSLTGKITFVYNSETALINIGSGKFFTLNFTINSGATGTSTIQWSDSPTARELSNSTPEIIPCNYHDGSVTVSADPVKPTVSTAAISSLAFNRAVSGGTDISDGGAAITVKGVCYSINENPTLQDLKTMDGSGVGSFSSLMQSLEENTTYHVRAYAQNSIGIGYGEDIEFRTPAAPFIHITSPIAGTWYISSPYQIAWTDNITENVNIYLYKGNDYVSTIYSSLTNTGTFNWTIPSTIVPGNDYRIKVMSINNSAVYSTSANFSILQKPVNCPDNYEPNNSPQSPSVNTFDQLGEINYTKTIYGTIHNVNDIDYYQISIASQGNITIILPNPPADYDLILMNESGAQVGTSFTSSSESINFEVKNTGTYFILVVGNDNATSCSNYSLGVTWQPAGCSDFYEPNDDMASANLSVFSTVHSSTEFSKTLNATIYPAGDYDFFKIRIDNPGSLNVTLNNPPAYYNIQLYDANNKFIAIKNAGDQQLWPISSTGYYYIIVGSFPNNEYSCSNYTVNVSWTPTSSPIIQATPSRIDFGNILVNTVSHEQSYMIDASGLTGNLQINAPVGFLISTSSTGSYGSTLSLSPVEGKVHRPVYVKFSPVSASEFEGNIVNSSTGAGSVKVLVTGKSNDCRDAYEPNDDAAHANINVFANGLTSVETIKSINGTVYPADDYDYYKVHVSNPGVIRAELINPPGSYSIQLHDENDDFIAIRYPGESEEWTINQPGYYYIIVSAFPTMETSCLSYNLQVTWSPVNSCRDVFEPNNSIIEANTTFFNSLGSSHYVKRLTGTMDQEDDVDVFKLTMTTTGTLTVTLKDPPINIDIEIDNPEWKWITGSHTAGDEAFSYSVTSPGVYYFMVVNYNRGKSCDNYIVDLDWAPRTFCADQYEPNNSTQFAFNNALPELGAGSFDQDIKGTIHAAGDWDLYKVNNTGSGILTFSMDNPPADFRLEFVDKDRQLIQESSTNGNEKIVQPLSGSGIYYLKVTGTNGSWSCTNYTMHVDWNTRTDQTLYFDPFIPTVYGANDIIPEDYAYSSSGLALSYSSDNTSVASIVNGKIRINGSGVCNIIASQQGNLYYNPARPVSRLLVVNKAPLTAIAVNKARTYGMNGPDLDVNYTGFMGDDKASVLDVVPAAFVSASAGSAPGKYPITLSGGADNNYSISLTSGELTITKGMITARAENKAKTYGAGNPELSIGYEGFVNNEDPEVIDYLPIAGTSASNQSPVGVYPIVLYGGTDNCYDLSLINGNMVINKALLQVEAVDQAMVEGSPVPELYFVYQGFVNGENENVLDTKPDISCNANESSVPGDYPILVSGGYDDNYDFVYVPGTLMVMGNPTGVWEDEDKGLILYPNPVDEALYISVKKSKFLLVSIVDMNGITVVKKSFSGLDNSDTFKISMDGILPGLYNVLIQTENNLDIRKIVKF